MRNMKNFSDFLNFRGRPLFDTVSLNGTCYDLNMLCPIFGHPSITTYESIMGRMENPHLNDYLDCDAGDH